MNASSMQDASPAGTATLWVGDCRTVLAQIPSGSVDLILTDPPYGIRFRTYHRHKHRIATDRGIQNDHPENLDLLSEIVAQCWRALKPDRHLYWFTRWDKLPEHLPMLNRHFRVKNVLIWHKGGFGMGDLTGAYANVYECVIFAQTGRRPLQPVNGERRHPDLLTFPKVPSLKLVHSHQKPVSLLGWLVQKSTLAGECILDPCVGSGSTLVASGALGRHGIGVELEAEHAAAALRRLLAAGITVSVRAAGMTE